MVNLYRCIGSCNNLYDLFHRICAPKKTPKDSNLYFLNIFTGINTWNNVNKTYNFDGKKCNSNQSWNNDKCKNA